MEIRIISLQEVDEELMQKAKDLEDALLTRKIPYSIMFAPIAVLVSESENLNSGLYVGIVTSKSSATDMEYNLDEYPEDEIFAIADLLYTEVSAEYYTEIMDISRRSMDNSPFSEEEVERRRVIENLRRMVDLLSQIEEHNTDIDDEDDEDDDEDDEDDDEDDEEEEPDPLGFLFGN